MPTVLHLILSRRSDLTMKVIVLASLIGSAAAFTQSHQAGTLNAEEEFCHSFGVGMEHSRVFGDIWTMINFQVSGRALDGTLALIFACFPPIMSSHFSTFSRPHIVAQC